MSKKLANKSVLSSNVNRPICLWVAFGNKYAWKPRQPYFVWYFRVFYSDGFPYFVAPAFSTPAFSTPAIYSRIFHSCIFHSRIFSAPSATSNNMNLVYWPWWVGHCCIIWYSEEGTGRGPSSPSPILPVPNVTARPSTASVVQSPYCCIMVCCSAVFNVLCKGLRICFSDQHSVAASFQ